MNPIADEPRYKGFILDYSKEQTRESYANSLAYLRKLLGKEIFDASDVELKDVFRGLRDKELSGGYLRTLKGAMNSFFKYEIENHLRKENPATLAMAFDTGKASSPNPKALTEEQKEHVFSCFRWEDSLQEKKIALVIIFGCYAGFRRFEQAKVEWDHIKWEDNEIEVRGKGRDKGEEDYVPLSPTLAEKLKDYRACVDKAGIDSRFIFFNPENPNKPVTRFVVGNWWKIMSKRSGIKLSSHYGRHYFCTRLYREGITPIDAIDYTRHKSMDMYAKRYVKKDEAVKQKKFKQAIP